MSKHILSRPMTGVGIWLAATMLAVACTLPARQAAVLKEEWRHDGYLVAVNQADDTADLVDLRQGKSVKKIPTGRGPHEVAVSPDGRLAAITNYGDGPNPGNSLTIASLPSGDVVKTIELGSYTRPHGIAWLDADRVLVTSESTRNVVQVHVGEGKVERAFATDKPGSHMLALDVRGRRVYTADIPAANVSAIDLDTGKKIGDAPAAAQSEGIAVSPDGRWIVTGNRSGSLSILDAKALKKIKNLPCPGMPYRASFTPDGKRALVPCPMSRELVVVDMARQEIEKRIPMSTEPGDANAPLAGPRGVCVHPKGRWAYVTLNESQSAAIVDLDRLQVAGKVAIGRSPDGIAYSPIAR